MIAETQILYDKTINEKVMIHFGFDFLEIWHNLPPLSLVDKLDLRKIMNICYELAKSWEISTFNQVKMLFYKINKHYELDLKFA